jgi:hypothetical protein
MDRDELIRVLVASKNPIDNYDRENMQLIQSIEICIERKLLLPSLVLIFTGIDISGWLDCKDDYPKPGKSFQNWVDNYLIKTSLLNCTALELWASRCGLLHTFTSESQIGNKLKVRKIIFAWGTASTTKIDNLKDKSGLSDGFTTIHIEVLFNAYKQGLNLFMESIAKDINRKNVFIEKISKYYTRLPNKAVDALLEQIS